MAIKTRTLILSNNCDILQTTKNTLGLNVNFHSNFALDKIQGFLKESLLQNINNLVVISTNPSKSINIVKILSAFFNVEHYGFNGSKLIDINDATSLQKKAVIFISMPKSGTVFIRKKIEQVFMTSDRKIFGGTWAEPCGQQLSIPLLREFINQGGISQSHLKPSKYNIGLLKNAIKDNSNLQILIHLRDPRQALVSFLEFYPNMPKTLKKSIDTSLNIKTGDNIQEIFFKHFYQNMIDFAAGWLEVSSSNELKNNILISTHEKLVNQPQALSQELNNWLDLDPDTIDLSTRPKLKEAHFRKGKTSEWKDYFSKEFIGRLNQKIDTKTFEQLDWSVN